MMKIKSILYFITAAFMIISCAEPAPKELPILGKKKIVEGKEVNHTIPDWTFLNQDSVEVTNKDLSDVVYVTDFFFRSCPTICPV